MRLRNYFTIFCFILSFFAFGQNTTTTASISDITIDKFGTIKWVLTYREDYSGYGFDVEHLQNGKWVTCGGSGMGRVGENTLSQQLITDTVFCHVKFHKGVNTYRLRMTYPEQIISTEFQLISKVSNDDGSLWIMDGLIYLDNIEKYEILDKFGATLLKGEKQNIDISDLPPGKYFLYTKAATQAFVK